jgi:phage-related protein
MSKFLNTQFSVTGIKDFDINQSYDQYDLIDYEFYTGNSVYPVNLSGLYAWFNLDSLNNIEFDGSGKISLWRNSAPGFSEQNLVNVDATVSLDSRPKYDSNRNSVVCERSLSEIFSYNQLYTTQNFSGFLTGDRCWFVVFEYDDLKNGLFNYDAGGGYGTIYPNYSAIINTDSANSYVTSGALMVYGNNIEYSWNTNVPKEAQQFIVDTTTSNGIVSPPPINSSFSASKLLKKKSIVSIIKNNTTNNFKLRNNGCELLNLTSDYFYTGAAGLRIGTAGNGHVGANDIWNYDASSISYYEIIGYSKTPTDDQILQIEKYLFEKHFTNDDGLYIANQDFNAANYSYAPINITGSTYLTKDVDSIFNKTYGCSANFTTKASKMQYGDGYYTNVISNVNNLTSDFKLVYDGLTDVQSKCLIGFFQNTFEYEPLGLIDSYQSVDIDLFYPYKNNAKIYFNSLNYSSKEANLNSIEIACNSPYDSNLDYKGFLVTGDDVTRLFDQNKIYFKDDVCFFKTTSSLLEDYYWYTGINNKVVNVNENPTGVNSLFTRKFYFKPDLNFQIPVNPRYIKNEYAMTAPVYENDGINKNILDFNLSFSNRSDKETLAILKFLDNKAGFKIFEIDLPDPYNKMINVYCPEWSHTYKFDNNHDISVKFLEFKGLTLSDVYFNTLISL